MGKVTSPFDVCQRVGCGHYRGVHLPGVGCVWCQCSQFMSKDWTYRTYQYVRSPKPNKDKPYTKDNSERRLGHVFAGSGQHPYKVL